MRMERQAHRRTVCEIGTNNDIIYYTTTSEASYRILVKLTFPRSRRYWHFVRQSGELVKVDRALSAAFRVAVSVASYSCLQRRSSCAISYIAQNSVNVHRVMSKIARGTGSIPIKEFSCTYLFLHICCGARRGQAHVACAWKQIPLIRSWYAGS